MHGAAMAYVEANRPDVAGDVLDVGGRDINGSPRHLFADATTYLVVDPQEGPNVDLVADIVGLGLEDFADTVLCLEVLEHAENWRGIVAACATACRPGGRVIVTCAGPGRAPHSAVDGGPVRPDEWYRNVGSDELAEAMTACGLLVRAERFDEDTRAMGVKP